MLLKIKHNAQLTFNLAWKRCLKLHAIPKYGKTKIEKTKILKVYVDAQVKNLQGRTRWQVDHIIPLQNPYVCGLHVSANLQVVLKSKNSAKGNLFTPYREVDGRKFYYKELTSGTEYKPKKKFKKSPQKLAKKQSKTIKNKLKTAKTLLKKPKTPRKKVKIY